jgi:hypothetical protein
MRRRRDRKRLGLRLLPRTEITEDLIERLVARGFLDAADCEDEAILVRAIWMGLDDIGEGHWRRDD